MKNTNSILSQRANLSIEQCSCCDNIFFLYNNLMLKFQPEGFFKFGRSFRKLNFDRRAIQFSDGSRKMLVNTRQEEIQLCFEKEEFEMVCRSLREAALMLEVNQILYPQT